MAQARVVVIVSRQDIVGSGWTTRTSNLDKLSRSTELSSVLLLSSPSARSLLVKPFYLLHRYHTTCDPEDYIIILSDGIHRNFDPEIAGYKPCDLAPLLARPSLGNVPRPSHLPDVENLPGSWKELSSLEASQLRVMYATALLARLLLPHAQRPDPEALTTTLLDYAFNATESDGRWAGRRDHCTCMCVRASLNHSRS